IESFGGKVKALTSIVNRSGKDEINGLELISATEVQIDTFDPDNLPDDLKDSPAVKPGSRK
ncbi:MAG: orotate phosphoribosyltransferase, partial [Anaerococcus vaginalis]|nr:orotate phosphoribosyltransferase [Anaerococcus vaginalis]